MLFLGEKYLYNVLFLPARIECPERNQMVSKHVCGYEQKITRIYDYGYTYDKRGNLVKEEEICSPTTTGPRNITMDLKKLQTTTLR